MSPELLHRPRRDGLRTWSTNARNSRLELGALAERENNKPLANVLESNSNAFAINHKHPQTPLAIKNPSSLFHGRWHLFVVVCSQGSSFTTD
jgi:hypothetical protein